MEDEASPRTERKDEPRLPSSPPRWPNNNLSLLTLLRNTWSQTLGSFVPSSTELDPDAAYDVFLLDFETEYGQTHPNFLRGSYSQALSKAKREFKFLIIYLHSPEHQNTPSFCKETLCSQLITDFINEHFLCWAGSIQHSEGYKASNFLQASAYPFLSVLVHNGIGGVTQLCQIQGVVSNEELILKLTTVLEEYGHLLDDFKQEHTERETDRLLREEQDLAYRQALAQDQEKERRAREEEERKKREEAMLLEKLKEKEQAKEQLKRTIPPEPSPDQPNVTSLVIRLTDGSRLQRRFLTSEKLQTVIDFINSQEQELEEFDLVTNFPRQVYSDPNLTLQSAGLYPQASLFVKEKE